jgi:hypothetical protein
MEAPLLLRYVQQALHFRLGIMTGKPTIPQPEVMVPKNQTFGHLEAPEMGEATPEVLGHAVRKVTRQNEDVGLGLPY